MAATGTGLLFNARDTGPVVPWCHKGRHPPTYRSAGETRRASLPAAKPELASRRLTGFFTDIHRLVRTETEHRSILAASNLEVARIIPTESWLSIIEASPTN